MMQFAHPLHPPSPSHYPLRTEKNPAPALQEKHRLSEDSAGEEGATGSPVGQRTRARNPLEGVTLEELEALLQEDIVETPIREDDAYREFLQVELHARPPSTRIPSICSP